MAYPTVKYNSSTGSDTAPSDRSGSGIGAWSGTNMELSGTYDFTSGTYPVADDGSDYVYFFGSTGNRHLAQITAFLPAASSCSAITTAETADAAEYSTSWVINGTRQTLTYDGVNRCDTDDWSHGWIIDLDGTFTMTTNQYFRPGQGAATATSTSPPILIRRASAASSRPVVDIQFNAVQFWSDTPVTCRGIEFTSTTGGGTNTYINLNSAYGVYFDDIVFSYGGNYGIDMSGSNPCNVFFKKCHFSNQVTAAIHVNNGQRDFRMVVDTCTIDGDAKNDYATAGIEVDSTYNCMVLVKGCQIFDCGGVGIHMNPAGGNEQVVYITGCTIVDNGGDGIEATGTATANENIVFVHNCLLAYNGAYAISDEVSTSNFKWYCDGNSFEANSSGNFYPETPTEKSPRAGPNDAGELSGDPFTDRASSIYSLNNNAGAGATCRGSAYPQSPPDGT